MFNESESIRGLQSTLELPCGAVLKNRVAKSPMSDSLGDGRGNPTEAQIRLYERWAEGGVALSFIGEVQGDPRFPEKPGNLVFGAHSNTEMLQALSSRSLIERAHLWPQLGHAGALSHPAISQPMGPSALDIEGLQCAGMSADDIHDLPDMYARTASYAARSRIVLEIIARVRRAVGPSFPVGIRINATDQLDGGLTRADALEVVRLLDRTSIDLIDISGGTYFPGAKASSEGRGSGPYFIDFARLARRITKVPLLVTGGFKRREQAVEAVASGAADMVGLGRAMALEPRLADDWLRGDGGNPGFPRFQGAPPGGVTAWYTMRLTALAEGRENASEIDLPAAIRMYEERDARRCTKWKEQFLNSSA